MASSFGSKIFMSVAVVVIILTTICFGRMLEPQYRNYQASKERYEFLKAKNAAKNAELTELRSRIERFASDEEFLIRVARENRRLLPGETLFIFPTPADRR